MIKLTDIAKLAHTSTSTVSKVLNHYPGVSETTRDRVMTAVKQLGYVPNASAQQLITKRSYLAGLLFTESLNIGLEHPLFGGIIESFRKTMNENGFDVIFISPHRKDDRISYLDHCRYRNLDGVFVCTFAGDDRELRELIESGIPCVTSDVDYEDIPLVVSDNVGGERQAYEYLYQLGHRDIAHIQGPQDTLSGRERLRGFREALNLYGSVMKPELVAEAQNFDFESGKRAAAELLEKRGGRPPEAIAAVSDIVALGAISELRSRGIRVPEDVSVIGFDNIELSAFTNPALTTMVQDRHRIGDLTAQALIANISGRRLLSRTIVPVTLAERESCRARGTRKTITETPLSSFTQT